MSEYDQRQYQRMQEGIATFEKGIIDLQHLISNLKALLSALESTSELWKQKFRNEWWTLEQVYASNLGDTELTQRDNQMIAEALKNIKGMLASVIITQPESD